MSNGYWIIEDNEAFDFKVIEGDLETIDDNLVVAGPFDTKSEAEKNMNEIYEDLQRESEAEFERIRMYDEDPNLGS